MIQVKELKKSYPVGKKKLEVLKGVDLEIEKGDMIAIMGRSGSGKSTLLNILAGLDLADSGTYRYEQDQISDLNLDELADFRRKKIGFILQNYALIDSKNVFENVALPLRYSKESDDEIKEKVKKILSSLDIEELKEQAVDQLSGGQAQRVAIARALIQSPELILADEPTGSLDEETEKEILALFKDLNQQGKTIILVTHNPQVAEICDQTVYIRDGRCLFTR
ncbi:ABC transporter ATP-binding protein [Desmospora profundinema]|uniref:ABC transport system ATP-binding protein n=1 Tax=Desmospora profundinema TaxID=1571184 RepID=A0ABU1IPF4_9BACL|nr:ABC transporter ATP-binding protein [Desmospora profundinema]MDR6226669.1 putative ABC transport system ATP-binding protein [Desmospora profundinema]